MFRVLSYLIVLVALTARASEPPRTTIRRVADIQFVTAAEAFDAAVPFGLEGWILTSGSTFTFEDESGAYNFGSYLSGTNAPINAGDRVRIRLLTTYATSDGIMRTLDAGASGAILKTAPDDEIVSSIRKVYQGERHYLSAEVRQLLADDPPIRELTDRQLGILRSITRGLTNSDIARQFGIREVSVKEHLARIFNKIGAANRAEAVAIVLRKHLLKI